MLRVTVLFLLFHDVVSIVTVTAIMYSLLICVIVVGNSVIFLG